MLNLEIRNRGGDFQVLKANCPAFWECGKIPEEALGRWLVTHGDYHGIYLRNAESVTHPAPSTIKPEP